MKQLYCIMFVLTIGCNDWNNPYPDQTKHERKIEVEGCQRILSSMVYAKDPRTGLCFAIWLGVHKAGMATVPCEKVQNELNK